MPAINFKLFINNHEADQDRLDKIEEIVVEQEVDKVWEARINMPLCVDERGMWSDQDEEMIEAFTRVRVEVEVGQGSSPLIDGPVVGYNNAKSAAPGESSVTVNVHDDSVYLNRQAQIERFNDKSDDQIARELFQKVDTIKTNVQVDPTPPPAEELRSDLVQRGTAIQILRQLARCQGMHVYVLPGANAGESIGCFKSFSTTLSDLPAMILLGKDQNITSFNLSNNGQGATQAQAFSLNISDGGLVSGNSSFRNLEFLGPKTATEEENAATAVERTDRCQRVSAERQANICTARNAYTLQATGEVLENCYTGVLRPYEVVQVRAVNSREAGNYLIKKVTHTLTRSSYRQSFTLISNALSEDSPTGVSAVVGSIV